MPAPAHASDAGTRGERSWDPLVRLTHWIIAAAVLVNGVVTEGGSQVHVWIGYAALAFLVLRLLWGAVGTEEARFSAFPPSLSAARGHVSDVLAGRRRRHLSHNPLGALMVYALWGTLAAVTVTGIGMAGSPFQPAGSRHAAEWIGGGEHGEDAGHGPEHGEEDEGVLEETHEIAANLLLVLAALHVSAVVIETRLSGTNLVRRMVSGERRTAGEG